MLTVPLPLPLEARPPLLLLADEVLEAALRLPEPPPGRLQPGLAVLALPPAPLLQRRPQRLLPLPLGGLAPLALPPPLRVELRRPQLGAQRATLLLREGLQVAAVAGRQADSDWIIEYLTFPISNPISIPNPD